MMANLVLETYGLGNVSLGSAYKMGINFSCTAIKVKEVWCEFRVLGFLGSSKL